MQQKKFFSLYKYQILCLALSKIIRNSKKNRLCSNKINNNKNLCTYYNAVSNFPFISPIYILRIYSKIKKYIQKKNENNNFLEILEYFKINYLNKYNANNWNYYKNIEHITNNASNSFNNYLNNLFPIKTYFL